MIRYIYKCLFGSFDKRFPKVVSPEPGFPKTRTTTLFYYTSIFSTSLSYPHTSTFIPLHLHTLIITHTNK